MSLTAQQRAALERRLSIHRVGAEAEDPLRIAISGRELCFIAEAIAHYRDTLCATQGFHPECELMSWHETDQGHLERSCERICDQLIDSLIQQVPDKQ